MTTSDENWNLDWRSNSMNGPSKHPESVVQPILKKWSAKCRELTMFDHTSRTDSVVDENAAFDDVRDLLRLKQLKRTHKDYHQTLLLKPHLKFYMGQPEAMSLFDDEMISHLKSGNANLAAILGIASGSLPKLVRLAKQYKQINVFLVALASSAGSSIVKNQIYDDYARGLANEEEYLQAAGFYFGCENPREAIRCLLASKCYRDAVLTCRVRLAGNDNLYQECINQWASRYIKERSFEAAAKCYISVDDYLHACEAIVKRDTVQSLELAVELAKMAGKIQLTCIFSQRCFILSMIDCNWRRGLVVVDHCYDQMQAWKYVLIMHQALICVMSKDSSETNIFPYEFPLDSSFFERDIRSLKRYDFLHRVWHIWINRGLDPNVENVQNLLNSLKTAHIAHSSALRTIMVTVALKMTQGLMSAALDLDEAEALFSASIELVAFFGCSKTILERMTRLKSADKSRKPCCPMDSMLNFVRHQEEKPVEVEQAVKHAEKSYGAVDPDFLVVKDLVSQMLKIIVEN